MCRKLLTASVASNNLGSKSSMSGRNWLSLYPDHKAITQKIKLPKPGYDSEELKKIFKNTCTDLNFLKSNIFLRGKSSTWNP